MRRKALVLILGSLALSWFATAASAATMIGKVQKVDAVARTLTVEEGTKDVAFSLDANARILNGPKAIALSSLKVGDRVTVEYKEQGGKHLATRVAMASVPVSHPMAGRKTESGKSMQ